MDKHEYPCESSNCIACLRRALRDLLRETPWQSSTGCKCSHCKVIRNAYNLAGEDA